MKKLCWWLLGIAASPFVIFLILTLLLYCPPIQRWAVGIATHYASEKTGKEISIDDVRLRFPLDLQLDGVKMMQRNDSLPQVRDTILDAQRLICNIQLKPLFDSQVNVDILQFDNVRLNTTDFISDCRVKGKVGKLVVRSHGIDLKADTVLLNRALLNDADLDICLSDTAQEDTTTTETPWKIRVQNLDVNRSKFLVHMPGDTLNIAGNIGNLKAGGGYFDLQHSEYEVAYAYLSKSQLKYDNTYEPRLKGLDYNHISLSDLSLSIDSLHYKEPDIHVNIHHASACEKSGLEVKTLKGNIDIDSTSVHVKHLALATPTSSINGNLDMDFTAFDAHTPGQLSAEVDASISKSDAMIFAGDMLPKDIKKMWPDHPSTIKGQIQGNMRRCVLKDVSVNVPTLASGHIDGTMTNLDNPDYLTADVRLNVNAARNNGNVKGKVHYIAQGMRYSADLNINSLNINHFMPGYGLGRFTGYVKADGHGTDIFSTKTAVTAKARIQSFRYGQYDLSGTTADLTLRNGIAHANVDAGSRIMNGNLTFDGIVRKNKIRATVGADVRNIDLYALHIVKNPFSVGICGHLDIDTDLKDYYKVLGSVSDIRMKDSAHVFHPDDIELDILTRRDTTHAIVCCGDFNLHADTHGGYRALMNVSDKLTKELTHQLSQRIIDEQALRHDLPKGHITVESGQENPVARFAKTMGYNFSRLYADVTSSPIDGLNGKIELDTLRTSSLQLDDIDLTLISDKETMSYELSIINGKDNPQYCFNAQIDGELMLNGTTFNATIDDEHGRRGLDVGMKAMMDDEGIRLSIDEDKQIIGYREFAVNDDNYIVLQKDMRVKADMRLVADDGTGIQIFTNDENATALQDVTFSIHNLDIAGITEVVPYMPKVEGVMDGDFHVIMNKDNMSISGDINTTGLVYEECPMGNISSQFTYMPKDDGSHYIDGILLKDDIEVAKIEGTYFFDDNGDRIDANLILEKMPMDIINGFVPDQLIGMKGIGTGTLSVQGPVMQPVVNGTFDLSQASLISVPYGITLRLDDTPVTIENSRVMLNDFRFYANNDSPITVNGYCDFANLEHITTSLRYSGQNVLLVDAKETRRSEAYGKGYVNLLGMVTGEVDKLKVRGKIEVLSNTNLYYILRDSPITTDNRLKELVTFTDLTQEQQVAKAKPTVEGMDMRMDITVNDGSHVICWINSNHTNYLDIIGSGDLRFTYAQEKMEMTGRYTISEGEMKYSLPVIPLKTFTISSDSYIEFTGDIMNPTLSITATETNRASATSSTGENRPVDFTCGVVLSKTLQNMGLQFIISAPQDNDITNQLDAMSIEDRGKLAVTMLTTGMYLADSNTSNITMNSALSSFLQQEINNIAGSALKTLDVQLGLQNSTQADGTFSTDYSFKFAKHFWNNRLSISIGGRVSTGTQASGKTPSFFDNVDIQYRLADNSNQYVGAFYKHDVYDYLEGYVDKYGVNYTWKRKLQRLVEIFPWVKSENTIVPHVNNDSINVVKSKE